MLLSEEWKEIKDYENYEISNLGRVRRNGKILKPRKNAGGYFQVNLYKNGIVKQSYIHRLVAYAFLPNPQNLPQINHKDENKSNNTVDNLEWCDCKYNNNYGTRKERAAENHCRPVLQFDREGNFIREWPSMIKVEEELGIYNQNISWCCLGKLKSAGGYLWQYKN